MAITVRPAASDEELAYAARRFEETIALFERYDATQERIAERVEQMRGWIGKAEAHVTVARTGDGRLVGFNSLFVTKDYDGTPLGKIVILYVDADHRRTGVARALKDEGEAWLRGRGVTRVVTEIDARNERMLEINRRAGFRVKSYTLVKDL